VHTTDARAFVLEAIMTAFLVWAVWATAVDPRGAFKAISGLAIGLSITMGVFVGGRITGAAMNPARRHEAERYRGIEVAAGDVPEIRDHDPDREAVRERNRDDVLPADDAGTAADEDEREGPDVLGDAPTEHALVHGPERYERHRTAPMRTDRWRRVHALA
jgi:hypothetical protein